MDRFLILLLAAAALIQAACTSPVQRFNAEYFVFGTLVEVELADTTESAAAEIFTQLQQEFQRLHRDWHAWEPGTLSDINAAIKAGKSHPLPDDLRQLILQSQELERQSGGRFNATIGELIGAWGFHTSEYPVLGPPPGADLIRELLNRQPSSHDLKIDNAQLRSTNPAVQLDFGGIAKGAAVDRAIRLIRTAGVPAALVNAGGDLRAFGRPGGQPWRIAIQNPFGGILGGVEIDQDEALFTSGNYQRFRQDQNQRYSHIIDPRSGWPVPDVAAVTVITRHGARGDAAATALVVAGKRDFLAVAAELAIDQALLVDSNGEILLTDGMRYRLPDLAGLKIKISAAAESADRD